MKSSHKLVMVGAFLLASYQVAQSLAANAELTFDAVRASNAKPVTGSLDSIDAGWAVRLNETVIAAGDLVELRREGVSRPLPPIDRAHLVLANGDRWGGKVHRVENDVVKFAPTFAAGNEAFGAAREVDLPLTSVAAMWLTNDSPGERPERLINDVLSVRRVDDHVMLTNGDVLRGSLTAVEPAAVKLDVAGKVQALPINRVAAILMSTDAVRPVKPKGVAARAVFADGSRVTLSEARVKDGRFVGMTPTGVTVRVLPERLVSLVTTPGPAVYLPDLKPLRYEHKPYLGVSWPLAVDRSVAGGPLQIGVEAFDRGLGMHSQSEALFAVPDGAKRFESWIGLNANARLGKVVVCVRVDGNDKFGPTEMTGGGPPVRLSLELPASARQLALRVDFGPGGDVQDQVDWGDARFVVPR